MRATLWIVICAVAVVGCGGTPGGDDADDDDGGTVGTVTLPQALGGAFAANPDVYPTISVHVEVDGDPDAVTVVIGEVATAAEARDGHWIADVAIDGLADGTWAVEAHATSGTAETTATADLVVSRTGQQLTRVAVDGNAGTPRVLEEAGHLYLTWTDSRDGVRTVRLAEIDGAGRFIGEPVALLDRADDVLYARTALGDGAVVRSEA